MWNNVEGPVLQVCLVKVVLLSGVLVACSGCAHVGLASTPARDRFSLLDYAALVAYLLATIWIGSYFARRERSTNDYFLGGKRVPWWAAGLSIYATSLSSITYLAIPGAAYSTDWVKILANTGILFMAPLVVFFYLPRFRRQPITTAYEFLEIRFNMVARCYGSLVFILFQIGRVSVVLFLPSLALSAATGLNVYASILVMGVVTTLYTMAGGIEAVIWTDVLQSFVLVGGAVMALVLICFNIDGGVFAAISTAREAGKFHTFNWTWDYTVASVWVCVVGNAFAMAYPSTADQCVVQRYLSTATEAQAARAVWTNALLTVPTSALFFGMGTALWVFYNAHPELVDQSLPNDAVLPMFVIDRFPAGLAGLLIAGIFAAAMSTLSSSLNSVSAVLGNDFYKRFCKGVSDRQELIFARVVTALFGAAGTGIAAIMAGMNRPSLFEDWLTILGLVGGGLAGIMALGIFTRRANGFGAMVGASVSAIVVWWVWSKTPAHAYLYGMIGFLTSFGVGYVASFLGGVRSEGVHPEG